MKSFFIIILSFLYINAYSQNINSKLIFKNEKVILLDSSLKNEKDIIYHFTDGCLYVLNNKFKIENNHIELDIFYYGKENKTFKIAIPNTFSSNKLYFSDFAVYDSLFFLLEINHLIIYDLKNSKLLNIIKLPYLFLKIHFEYPEIIITNCFLSSDNRYAESQTYIYTYNLIEQYGQIKHLRNPVGFKFVIFGHMSHLDYCANKFLLSDVTKYNILILDTSLDSVDKLTRTDELWLSKTPKRINNFNPNSRRDLSSLMEEASSYPIIHKANFIDSNSILVMYSRPDSSNEILGFSYLYDLWVKEDIWKLKYKDLVNKTFTNNELFSPELLEISNKYNIDDAKILKLHLIPFMVGNSDFKNLSFESFVEKVNSFFLKNELRFSIVINDFIFK